MRLILGMQMQMQLQLQMQIQIQMSNTNVKCHGCAENGSMFVDMPTADQFLFVAIGKCEWKDFPQENL